MTPLDRAIAAAKKAVTKVDWSNPKVSLVDKMRPYCHLNNLISVKIESLINKENNDNGNKQN